MAQRWQWCRPKARAFLDELRELRKITYKIDKVATIITVLDYDVFNPKQTAEVTAEVRSDLTAEPPSIPVQNAEIVTAELTRNLGIQEFWKRKIGTLEGPQPAKNSVELKVAIEWCRKNQTGFSDDEVTAAWNGLTAVAVNGLWTVGGRTGRRCWWK